MTNLTYNDMISLRQEHAKKTSQSRFVINAVSKSKDDHSKNKDKDGLSRDKRKAIEEIKDRQTYTDECDLW